MTPDQSFSVINAIAAGLLVVAAGEILASQYFAAKSGDRTALISTLLLWEGIAMFACAAILWVRQDFSTATLIAIVAVWLAGAGIGLLRAGFFDAPPK